MHTPRPEVHGQTTGPGEAAQAIWEASYPPLLLWPYGVHSGFPRPVCERGEGGGCRRSFARGLGKTEVPAPQLAVWRGGQMISTKVIRNPNVFPRP